MNRKAIKKDAKKTLKKHYWLLVFVCIIAMFLGVKQSSSLSSLSAVNEDAVSSENTDNDEEITQESSGGGVVSTGMNFTEVLSRIANSDANSVAAQAEEIIEQDQQKTDGAFGRSRGVFAQLLNKVSSGQFYVTLFAGVATIIGSKNVAVMILTVLSLILSFALWYFIKNVFSVISGRIFLESRVYNKVSVQRFLFLSRVKKWCKVAWTMFVKMVFLVLWFITIIGGFIKTYSYAMVPYILAENPGIGTLEAITLSRRMMNGHKWECFKLDISLLGWWLLGIFTFGVTDILFYAPYKDAIYAEVYTEFRKNAKNDNIDGADKLNDTYLFEMASDEAIAGAYGDVLEIIKQPLEEPVKPKGILGFIANVFGVVLFRSKEEDAYEKAQTQRIKITHLRQECERESYPRRLFTIPEKAKLKRQETLYYLRHYTVWNLILMFFTFAFIGWVWEVSLHLISDGVFVNRGVLHGPWLPIYGTGGILILVALYKFRKYPMLEFFAAIVLCGIVEYFTAYQLEMSHGGTKWWDYSGYFLNLHGRICAEGLLVFGLGGMAIVYLVAPMVDNLLKKIPFKVIVPICILLLAVYICDFIYSQKHPNIGKGITDYASISESTYVVVDDINQVNQYLVNIGGRA